MKRSREPSATWTAGSDRPGPFHPTSPATVSRLTHARLDPRPDEYLPLIARQKYFKHVGTTVLRAMLGGARKRRVRRREILFGQDDPAATPYLLIHGRMKVTYLDPEGGQIIVRFVNPGEGMGGLGLLGIPNYMVSAEATEDSVVLAWDAVAMDALLTRHPSITFAIAMLMADRIKELIHRLAEISTLPVEQRLARAVLRLAQATEPAAQTLVVSQQDLAEYCGTTLYTVSRVVSAWTRRRLVATGRKRLTIKSMPGLSAIATRAHPLGRRAVRALV